MAKKTKNIDELLNEQDEGVASAVLLACPHCGSISLLKLEGKLFSKILNKKVQFARIVCSANNPFGNPATRCLAKTVAAPIEQVINHWNKRVI